MCPCLNVCLNVLTILYFIRNNWIPLPPSRKCRCPQSPPSRLRCRRMWAPESPSWFALAGVRDRDLTSAVSAGRQRHSSVGGHGRASRVHCRRPVCGKECFVIGECLVVTFCRGFLHQSGAIWSSPCFRSHSSVGVHGRASRRAHCRRRRRRRRRRRPVWQRVFCIWECWVVSLLDGWFCINVVQSYSPRLRRHSSVGVHDHASRRAHCRLRRRRPMWQKSAL